MTHMGQTWRCPLCEICL